MIFQKIKNSGDIMSDSDLKILFCGMFKTPFIVQDYELLKKHYHIIPIHTDIVWEKREGIFIFLGSVLTNVMFKIYKTDVVYIWFADIHAFPLIILAKLFGKKIILTIGGGEVADYPEIGYGMQLSKWRSMIVKWCIRHSDIVVVPSIAYKHITENLVPKSHVCVIPNAINELLWECSLPVKSNKAVTALYNLGNTSILKGIPIFEKAMQQLPYECNVYDTVDHEYLMNKLREAHVYCQLSYTESFGITNLEAMACGCVPVVTDRGALPEIVGNSGIIVPYGDVKATVEAIKKAMVMDGNVARERSKYFTVDKRLNLLSKVIENEYTPLVSVVIPAYNAAKWLPDTIGSILNQTYSNIEIILVDDCSTDNTFELVSKYPSVKYFKNHTNMGECISSRRGFDESNGDYICRLSADDMYANPDKIRHQVKIMMDTGSDWSYNSINCVGETLERAKQVESFWMVMPTRYGHNILQLFDNYILRFPYLALIRLLSGNPVNSSTLMFRRSCYITSVKWSIGKRRTDCDGLLLLNLFLKRYKCVAIREMGSFYRFHPDQMSYNPTYINDMRENKLEVINKVITGNYPFWLKCIVKFVRRKYEFRLE